MAYTIIRSSGASFTIQDGTINTTNTSLALPGRNYAGYGQAMNTNFVRLLENFASPTPPSNALKGQLWLDTSGGGTGVMRICPNDGNTTASAWDSLATTSGVGTTTLSDLNAGNITLPQGNIVLQNGKIDVAGNILCTNATVNTNATINGTLNAHVITTSGVGNGITTANITTGGTTVAGTLTGKWNINGSVAGNAVTVSGGNLFVASGYALHCDNFYWSANNNPISFAGTYTDQTVYNYLTGLNGGGQSGNQFDGPIKPSSVTTPSLVGGGLSGAGVITGTWSLGTNSTLKATYADLAERYEADAVYAAGTVVEIGGEKEVTAAGELSENVFGVVSNKYAYLMNEDAGTDETHPPIALAGRVPVNVIGKVQKGQRLVSAGNGFARAGSPEEITAFNVIGRALANKDDEGQGQVEATVIAK